MIAGATDPGCAQAHTTSATLGTSAEADYPGSAQSGVEHLNTFGRTDPGTFDNLTLPPWMLKRRRPTLDVQSQHRRSRLWTMQPWMLLRTRPTLDAKTRSHHRPRNPKVLLRSGFLRYRLPWIHAEAKNPGYTCNTIIYIIISKAHCVQQLGLLRT